MPRKPRVFALVLAAIGLGVVLWHGEQRARLPQWTEAEVEQSVELNLQLELQRRGPHLQPQGERLDALRRTLRAEVEGEIRRERDGLDRWIGAGLLLVMFGAGQWLADVFARRASH